MPFTKPKRYQDGLGMDVVYPPKGQESEGALVDIVFVHGLGGRRHSTWGKGDFFWPVDLLAKDFPRSRIMTWGYDSKVMQFLGQAGQGTVHGHANEFINDLSAERSERNEIFRPIIFFAHSLGGLIIKHALFRSWVEFASERQRKDRIAAIERSTIGVIFAGTPHRGSDKTKWADFASKFAKVVHKDHSTKLTNALKQGSDVVQTLEEWFKQIQSNFHIFSFYEEKPVAAIGTVVEPESAKINCDHEKVRMLHGNHMDIVRYGDEHDNSYKKVKDAFKQMHQHDLSETTSRDITQPPPRLSGQGSFSNSIEDGRPTTQAGQASLPNVPNNRMLEYQTSRLNLGSTQTLTVEEVVEDPLSRPSSDHQLESPPLSAQNLANLPYRHSSMTVHTLASNDSHRSGQSAQSSDSTNSAAAQQARTQYYAIFQKAQLMASNNNRNYFANLEGALGQYQEALKLLQSPPLSTSSHNNAHVAYLLYQMTDVAFRLSFQKQLTSEEKLERLSAADAHAREASNKAQLSSSTGTGSNPTTPTATSDPNDPKVINAQAMLYMAIIKGRKADLLSRLPTATPSIATTAQQKLHAVGAIDAAISQLRTLNPSNLAISEQFAREYRTKFGGGALIVGTASPPRPLSSSSRPNLASPISSSPNLTVSSPVEISAEESSRHDRPGPVPFMGGAEMSTSPTSSSTSVHHLDDFGGAVTVNPNVGGGSRSYPFIPAHYHTQANTNSQHQSQSFSNAHLHRHHHHNNHHLSSNNLNTTTTTTSPNLRNSSTSTATLSSLGAPGGHSSHTGHSTGSTISVNVPELTGTSASEPLPAYSDVSSARPRDRDRLPRYSTMDPLGGGEADWTGPDLSSAAGDGGSSSGGGAGVGGSSSGAAVAGPSSGPSSSSFFSSTPWIDHGFDGDGGIGSSSGRNGGGEAPAWQGREKR